MRERSQVIEKKSYGEKRSSAPKARNTEFSPFTSSPADRILSLQRTIGNQAVQRLFKSGIIQAKLKMGQPNDIYEQEADRMAEQVMQMPEPQVQRQLEEEEEELLQPKLEASPRYFIQRQEEEEKKQEILQTENREDTTPEVTHDFDSQIQAIRGGGQPLSESERVFFEPRFGVDFGQVRVHTDAQAGESARAVNARAYTLGQDVVFGQGQYAPGTAGGRRLMAHELTHVIQQSQSRPTVTRAMSASSKIKQSNIFARKAKAHATRLPAGFTTGITHRPMKPSVVRIQRSTFAFYTMGDTRTLRGCPGLTRSDMYQAYARTVASQVFGVVTDGGALSQITRLQPNSVNRALFVGHGNRDDGYFFSGSPRGVNNFISSLPNMFDSGDINLMNALERVLVPQGANVEFHACYVGNSPLVGALQGILNTARYQTGNIVNITAYGGMSVLRPIVQNCRITGFQPPPRGTTWQAGRIPRLRP